MHELLGWRLVRLMMLAMEAWCGVVAHRRTASPQSVAAQRCCVAGDHYIPGAARTLTKAALLIVTMIS